jgi:predicted TIM-barrel fold metal-dependent hydrolase
MEIVDAQLHVGRGGMERTLAAMDALGIGAVLIDEYWGERPIDSDPTHILPGFKLPNGAWRHTCPIAEEASSLHPDRFSYLVRVDRNDPDLACVMRIVASMPHALAVRVQPVWTMSEARAFAEGAYDELFDMAGRNGLPIFLFMPGFAELLVPYLRKFPNVTFVVDHTGMPFGGIPIDQPETERARKQAPAYLDEVLKLAQFPNAALKWSHAQSCFDVHDYPYQPIRGYLNRAIGAFGADRVMWASDSSVIPRHSWSDILHYVRDDPDLTPEEKAWVLGGSARKVLNWQKN